MKCDVLYLDLRDLAFSLNFVDYRIVLIIVIHSIYR